MTTEEKINLSNEIKDAAYKFNTLLMKASVLKLQVNIKQAFHPMTNMNSESINAPINVTITETLNY